MLILTRKTEQAILIDGNIIVRVLGIEGERVKLGIEAPRSIVVLREELVREVAGVNREAAGVSDATIRARVRSLRRRNTGKNAGKNADSDANNDADRDADSTDG